MDYLYEPPPRPLRTPWLHLILLFLAGLVLVAFGVVLYAILTGMIEPGGLSLAFKMAPV